MANTWISFLTNYFWACIELLPKYYMSRATQNQNCNRNLMPPPRHRCQQLTCTNERCSHPLRRAETLSRNGLNSLELAADWHSQAIFKIASQDIRPMRRSMKGKWTQKDKTKLKAIEDACPRSAESDQISNILQLTHIKSPVCPPSQIEFWFLFVYLHWQSSRPPFNKWCNTDSFTFPQNLFNILHDLYQVYLFSQVNTAPLRISGFHPQAWYTQYRKFLDDQYFSCL